MLAAAALAAFGGTASADMIDFNALVHGQIVTTQFQASHGVTISALNPNTGPDLAIAFDSNQLGTADPDLQGPPWSGGNLPLNTPMGSLLILAENYWNPDHDDVLDIPDDEAGMPAGWITFDFDTAITSFGFDMVDVEGVPAEDTWIDFYLGEVFVGSVGYSDLVTPGHDWYDPTIDFGDNTINRVSPILASDFGQGPGAFDRVSFHLGGSMGLDNITFSTVPSPGALALLGLAGLVTRRRRR